ncbi:MAG: signal peptide protein, partial [Herminiimonas sp.]|nr:signal peptide protein [Herminiimonas sp.]
KTNSYRCPGDPQYGQGRDGMLLKETEVEQNGARPQMGKRCW